MTKTGVWYIGRNGAQRGPLSHDQFVALRDSGEIRPSDLLWREGWSDWAVAEQVPEAAPPPKTNPPITSGAKESVHVRKWDRRASRDSSRCTWLARCAWRRHSLRLEFVLSSKHADGGGLRPLAK